MNTINNQGIEEVNLPTTNGLQQRFISDMNGPSNNTQINGQLLQLQKSSSTVTNDVFRQMEMERQSIQNIEEFQNFDQREDMISMTNAENQTLYLSHHDSMKRQY